MYGCIYPCLLYNKVKHVTAFFGSALTWLFEDPKNVSWNEPSGSMVGNGFGWGQMSHLLGWVLRVTGLEPVSVACVMVRSQVTGADLHDSATVTCACGATISLSGTACVPGNEHAKTIDGGVKCNTHLAYGCVRVIVPSWQVPVACQPPMATPSFFFLCLQVPVGKVAEVKVFGSEGALFYGGSDNDPASGRLELRRR